MPADCNVIDVRGDKSYVYDLAVQRGIVSSRVALLLRSAEVKPLLSDLFFYFFVYYLRPGKGGEGMAVAEAVVVAFSMWVVLCVCVHTLCRGRY